MKSFRSYPLFMQGALISIAILLVSLVVIYVTIRIVRYKSSMLEELRQTYQAKFRQILIFEIIANTNFQVSDLSNVATELLSLLGRKRKVKRILIDGIKHFCIAITLVFLKFKVVYSLHRNFQKESVATLGDRDLKAHNADMHSVIAGVGKYIGNYWLNLKGYLIDDSGRGYQSYKFTSQYYLNNELDYLTLLLSIGTSLDDRNLNFDYHSFVCFLSNFIGIGYKKSFERNYNATVLGAWGNQKIGESNYLNQFDLYLSLSKSF